MLRLERLTARGNPSAKEIGDDIHWKDAAVIRLLYVLFERDDFSAKSQPGQRWIRGLLLGLPDNKLVEDIHGYLRNEANANRNTKLNIPTIQDVVQTCGALESRGIPHPQAVTREVCMANFRSASVHHDP